MPHRNETHVSSLLALGLALAGCSSQTKITGAKSEAQSTTLEYAVESEPAPAPAPAAPATPSSEYLLEVELPQRKSP